jgi:hypothetical protein
MSQMTEEAMMKRCSKCGEVKPLTEFYKDLSKKDGFRNDCKSCFSRRRREYYAENKEEILAKNREYNLKNRDSIRKAEKAYNETHSEEIKQYRRSRHVINRDKNIARSKDFYEENKPRILEEQKDKRRKRPSYSIFYAAKNRAKENNIPFSLVEEDVVIPRLCPILGIPLERGTGVHHDESPSLDRIVPELGYIRENVAVISYRANTLKTDGTAKEHRLIANWIEGISSFVFETTPAVKKHLYRLTASAKGRAKRGGFPFSITKEDFLIPSICPILGIPIRPGLGKMQDSSPTLDKIIPELGYVPGNVAVISWRANRIKNVGTAAEHRQIADWIDTQLNRPDNGQTPEASD